MASKVILFRRAKDELSALPSEVRKRIARAIDDLELYPEARTGIKKLKPPFEGYKKRIGDYRILFDFDAEVRTVFVYRIRNRRDAYR